MLTFSKAGEMALARTLAALPEGSWITDYISLGVITKTPPVKSNAFGARGVRHRQPAQTPR
jgi:hypothetical protein